MGNALGVVLLLVVFGAASTGGDAPRINDITTDLDARPVNALEKGVVLSCPADPELLRTKRPGGARWELVDY